MNKGYRIYGFTGLGFRECKGLKPTLSDSS